MTEETTKNYVVQPDHQVTDEQGKSFAAGEVVALNPESELAKRLIAEGAIVADLVIVGEKDFIVTQEYLDLNPAEAEAGTKVGDTIKVPVFEGDVQIADTVVEPTVATPGETVAPVMEKRFRGKVVVRDGYRSIPDSGTVRHISVEDGSEYDLSESDYQKEVVEVEVKTN